MYALLLWTPGPIPKIVPPNYHYNPSRPQSHGWGTLRKRPVLYRLVINIILQGPCLLGWVSLELTFVTDLRECGDATQSHLGLSLHPIWTNRSTCWGIAALRLASSEVYDNQGWTITLLILWYCLRISVIYGGLSCCLFVPETVCAIDSRTTNQYLERAESKDITSKQ